MSFDNIAYRFLYSIVLTLDLTVMIDANLLGFN